MKSRKKRSIIWRISKEELKEVVARSKSISDVLKHFGFNHKGNNHNTLWSRLNYENIDTTHITRGMGWNKGRRLPLSQRRPLRDLLVENGKETDRPRIKKRLIEEKILPYKCQQCGLDPTWNGKVLSLVLDHINGKSNDHRLENLRFLCPNCNSQQDTFAGKNKPPRVCIYCKCGKPLHKSTKSGLCARCCKKTKANYPSIEILCDEADLLGYEAVGRKYGVTGGAIKRRIVLARSIIG